MLDFPFESSSVYSLLNHCTMERDGLITVGYVPNHLTHRFCMRKAPRYPHYCMFFSWLFIFSVCSSEEKDGETKDEKGE